ncbi:MAG: hypothetical protein O3A92_03075, partial [Verrucomicrobia bacterium]|nr:hypothetical protein [Verrucomicrobiota bacterium]
MKWEYYPGLITKRAPQFVDQHKDEPFLLYMGFNLPHYPEPERKDYLKEKPGIARRLLLGVCFLREA